MGAVATWCSIVDGEEDENSWIEGLAAFAGFEGGFPADVSPFPCSAFPSLPPALTGLSSQTIAYLDCLATTIKKELETDPEQLATLEDATRAIWNALLARSFEVDTNVRLPRSLLPSPVLTAAQPFLHQIFCLQQLALERQEPTAISGVSRDSHSDQETDANPYRSIATVAIFHHILRATRTKLSIKSCTIIAPSGRVKASSTARAWRASGLEKATRPKRSLAASSPLPPRRLYVRFLAGGKLPLTQVSSQLAPSTIQTIVSIVRGHATISPHLKYAMPVALALFQSSTERLGDFFKQDVDLYPHDVCLVETYFLPRVPTAERADVEEMCADMRASDAEMQPARRRGGGEVGPEFCVGHVFTRRRIGGVVVVSWGWQGRGEFFLNGFNLFAR